MFMHSTATAPHSGTDARGCPVSGATGPALQAYEAALAAFQNWRCGAEPLLDAALHEAPAFVMAHVLKAYLLVCSRDPRRVRAAAPVAAGLRGLPANARERAHIAALQAVLADDIEGAKSRFSALLRLQPRDVRALQMAHAFDYLSGLPSAELKTRLGGLPADSIVFTPGFFRDGDGQLFVPLESVRLVAAASSAPVYSPYPTFIGAGIVGGSMASFAEAGQLAAQACGNCVLGIGGDGELHAEFAA